MNSLQLQKAPLKTPVRILSVHGVLATRLRELGIRPGVICTVRRRALLGGPIEVATGQTRVAVRLTPELQVLVELV